MLVLSSWIAWFDTTPSEAILVAASAAAMYLALIGFTRIAGLRSISKMSSFDFATTVAFGSILAATALKKDPPVAQAVVALAALFGLQALVAVLRRRNGVIKKLVDNRPILLMEGQTILHENLARARVTLDDLYAKLRESNVLRWRQVRAVIMETSGDITVMHTADDEVEIDADLLRGVRGAERFRSSESQAPGRAALGT